VNKLNGAKLHIQTGLHTGFPGAKPNVDALVNGQCPTRRDGFPQAGAIECCYSPTEVENCTKSPYGKGCESFIAGSLSFGGDKTWAYEHRESSDPDSFDQTSLPKNLPNGGWAADGIPRDFGIELDFAAEKYKYFRFGGKSWNMDEPLMNFSRDRNCNHIRDWPEASFEFSIRLEPPTTSSEAHALGYTADMDAEVHLTHLEVNRRKECTQGAGALR